MSKRTPPFPEHPDWSTARFYSFLRSALRQAWLRWPPRSKVIDAAKRTSKSTNKRLKWEYECNKCGKFFPKKEVQVDHITEAGTLREFSDLPGFVQRMFVGEDKLRLVCINCHKEITEKSKNDRRG